MATAICPSGTIGVISASLTTSAHRRPSSSTTLCSARSQRVTAPSYTGLSTNNLGCSSSTKTASLRNVVKQSLVHSNGNVASRGRVSMKAASNEAAEEVFFDGGPHFGDLASNLVFGLTGVWLPLTLAAVTRALFLRYRFTNKRVTVMSTLGDNERKDFPYSAVVDVKYIPRFIGEWGDMAITLSDKTIVELKCVPKFRELAAYTLEKAAASKTGAKATVSSTIGGPTSRGF
eukprot:jgi/Mesen1/6331/ME000328S05614